MPNLSEEQYKARRLMDPLEYLEAPSNLAFARLKAANGDISALPLPLQTLILVSSAQGVIDNGGFEYFFESDWPGSPSYLVFSDAYRAIGATQIAEAIERAVTTFPFDEAHLKSGLRNDFIESLPPDHVLIQLGDSVCGDESVWLRLSEYVRQNAQVFQGA